MNDSNGQPEHQDKREEIESFIHDYIDLLEAQFDRYWETWPISVTNPGPTEVTIALLHRQMRFVCWLAWCPMSWTPEFATVVHRCMVELYIWLAWILDAPEKRAQKFIEDGLGKEKLVIKHRTDQLESCGDDPDEDPYLQSCQQWIDGQRLSFMVDVNLSGSWSGLDVRSMAEEAGCRDFYRFNYPALSAAVHSTWNHVSRWDLEPCANPLHAHHRVPSTSEVKPNSWALETAARFMELTFRLVQRKLGLTVDVPSAYEETFGGIPDDLPVDRGDD